MILSYAAYSLISSSRERAESLLAEEEDADPAHTLDLTLAERGRARVTVPGSRPSYLVFSVVLTGGPLSGKVCWVLLAARFCLLVDAVGLTCCSSLGVHQSACCKYFVEQLTAEGYDVYLAPEVPTLLLNAGCRYPKREGGDMLQDFEASLMQLQYQLENSFFRVRMLLLLFSFCCALCCCCCCCCCSDVPVSPRSCAMTLNPHARTRAPRAQIALSTGRPSVIIYDRGLMDVQAFVPHRMWKAMLERNSWSEETLLARYDLVIHLMSAASSPFLEKLHLESRLKDESVADARELDQLLLQCWSDHPMRSVVPNFNDFSIKRQRALTHLFDMMRAREQIYA